LDASKPDVQHHAFVEDEKAMEFREIIVIIRMNPIAVTPTAVVKEGKVVMKSLSFNQFTLRDITLPPNFVVADLNIMPPEGPDFKQYSPKAPFPEGTYTIYALWVSIKGAF